MNVERQRDSERRTDTDSLTHTHTYIKCLKCIFKCGTIYIYIISKHTQRKRERGTEKKSKREKVRQKNKEK